MFAEFRTLRLAHLILKMELKTKDTSASMMSQHSLKKIIFAGSFVKRSVYENEIF